MRATGDDVANCLRMLGAAFPTFPLDELTLETYVRSLCAAPIDASVLNAAAVQWVATEDRYPTVHKLTEAYQAEARHRMQLRADAEANRILAAGGLPGVALDPGYAVEMLDVLRSALAQVGRSGFVHQHQYGAENCPTCSRADAIAMDVAAAVDNVAAARGLRPPPGVETYRCAECSDLGVIIEADEPYTVRPCMACQPEAHERWLDGHLMPGHSCAECRGRR